uniref:DNA-directed DNA polymerase n=1 Tax=Coniferiporia sulphurascens TaxID=175648 RepID=A0A5B9RCM3_CONSH|nr:DNA polymerase family B [Coniferiporia sulphurascens]QEG57183.1 DNA polymerase family B [Coniferiporia sulphurascens]
MKPLKGRNMITLDLETYLNNNDMSIYCASFYNGLKNYSYYITDYVNLDAMLDALFSYLFTRTKMDSYKTIFNNSLGVFNVRTTAPSIPNPILPFKQNNTTVYGEGSWTGWYFSEELVNATKYGYTYEILSGYLFDSEDIFSGYVNKMYQMKEEASKDSTAGEPTYDPIFRCCCCVYYTVFNTNGCVYNTIFNWLKEEDPRTNY